MSDGRDAGRVEREAAARVGFRERAAPFEHKHLLRLGLGRMNHQWQPFLNRQAREHLKKLWRDCVGRVRRESELNERGLSAAQRFNLRACLVELLARET